MKNFKNFFTSIIVMLFAVITIFTLSACENSNGSHCQHQWVDADCLYPKTCRLCSETEGQSLGHSWQEPTCTTPKICTRCHKTEGEALGHSFSTQYSKDVSNHWYECYCGEKIDVKAHVWDKGKVTKEPSETEKGITLYTCVCGQTREEEIAMLEHIHKFDDNLSYDDIHHWYPSTCGHDDSITKIEHEYNWTTQSDATCEDAEVLLGTCECGHTTIKDGQDALGHNYEATYTWSGYKECEITLICKNDLSHIVIASMTITSEVEKKANCYDEGKRLFTASYIHGGVEYTDIKTEKLEKKDHNFESGACTLCSAMDIDSQNSEIEAENSRYEQAIADNTCVFMDLISEVEDEIAYRKSEYNISYVYDSDYCRQKMSEIEEEMTQLKKYIDVYSTGQWDDSVKAKLQKYKVQYAEYKEQYDKYEQMLIINGLYEDMDYYQEEYKECLLELEEIHNANLEAIDKKYECAVNGHTIIIDEAVEPTCTETGLTEGSHCSNCGYVIVEQNIIGNLGHTEIIDPAVEETCTTNGKTEGSHCSACGDIIIEQETISMHHTEVVDEGYDATCINDGLTDGKHCSVCNEVLVEQEVILSTGHTEVIDEAVDATCTTSGLTEGKHCSVCNEVLVEQEVILSTGHTEVIDEAVDATCTTSGLTEGKHCSVCNEVLVIQEEIPIKHNYINYVCNDCGFHYYTEGLEFTLSKENDGYIVTNYTGVDKIVVIPDVYNNIPVTCINANAFSSCSMISIIIPSSVVSIGNDAFYACSLLSKVYYEGTIEGWCNLSFSSSYANPMWYAEHFYMINEKNEWSEVTHIEIPSSVTVLGDRQFYGFNNLTSILISNSVTSIGNYAFQNCTSLRSIVIPESVTSIGKSAFYNCSSLITINIPDGATSIGICTFSDCTSLNNIEISKNVTSIGWDAFYRCYSLTDVYYTGTEVQWDTIDVGSNNTALTNATIHYVQDLEYRLTDDSYEVIGIGSVTDSEIDIPSTYKGLPVTSIGENAFGNYDFITKIVIPNSIRNISDYAFLDCSSLKSIIIPGSVINIGDYAIALCYSLESITIESGIETIGAYAFYNNCVLKDIYFTGTEEQWDNIEIEESYLDSTSATIHFNYVNQ